MSNNLAAYRFDGRVARITLSRPDERNRINVAMMHDIIDGLQRAQDDRAELLLIDALGPDFSVGRDQTERVHGMSKRDSLALILESNSLLGSFAGLSIVSLCGRARGFGAGLAVQSDLTVAADDATIAFDEIDHGFAPTIVMTYLADAVGPKRALDLTSTGRTLTAVQAMEFGIVNRVVDPPALETATDDLLAAMLGRNPTALRMCKQFSADIRAVPADERGERALAALLGEPARRSS